MSVRALAVAVLLTLAGASAASAAPTLVPDRACYPMDREQSIKLTGSGYTPGGDVKVMLDGNHVGQTYTVAATSAGAVTAQLDIPWLTQLGFRGATWRELIAIDTVDLARLHADVPDPMNAFAVTHVTITDWGVRVVPWDVYGVAVGLPKQVVTFDVMGWTWIHGKPIYAHYLRKGKLVHTERLAVPTGPCGDATLQLPEFPFRPVPAGTYRIQFDASAALHTPGSEWAAYYRSVRVAPKDAVR